MKKKVNPYGIKLYKSRFFWRQCKSCNDLFKKELGYVFNIHRVGSIYRVKGYLCNECSCDLDIDLYVKELNQKINNDFYRIMNGVNSNRPPTDEEKRNRPKPTPSPPKVKR